MECSRESCNREADVKGLCRSHYISEWQSAKLASKKGLNSPTCEQCGMTYVPQRQGTKNRFCSPACKAKMRVTEGRMSFANRAWQLKTKYGLSVLQYQEMKENQGGGCALCGTTTPVGRVAKIDPMWLHVDHNHETGEVRGLLCLECNVGLGKFQDDPELLIKAANYLKASLTPDKL